MKKRTKKRIIYLVILLTTALITIFMKTYFYNKQYERVRLETFDKDI